jgi:acyl dehydratase
MSAPPRVIHGISELRSAVGQELGVSRWVAVPQPLIDAFAETTGDRYWAHVDPRRAAESPLGTTIAHGLLTLSLGPAAMYAIVSFEGFSTVLNAGYDKVRFVAPVPAGASIRLRAELAELSDAGGGVRAKVRQTFELRDGDRPACVAELMLHFAE